MMQAVKSDFVKLDRLRKRSDFLWLRDEGKRWVSKGMTIQAAPNEGHGIRFGITVTKRLEKSAVARNRMKRRLKAVATDILSKYAKDNMDYVLIARIDTATRLFTDLNKDLKWCLKKLDCLK